LLSPPSLSFSPSSLHSLADQLSINNHIFPLISSIMKLALSSATVSSTRSQSTRQRQRMNERMSRSQFEDVQERAIFPAKAR
jgi:hypothetical protein